MKRLLFLLMVVFLLIGCQAKEDAQRGLPIGLIYSYEQIDRSLTLEDFGFVEKGTLLEEIRQKIGEPNGNAGSGISYSYYESEDHSVVMLMVDYSDETVVTVSHNDWEKDQNGEWVVKNTPIC